MIFHKKLLKKTNFGNITPNRCFFKRPAGSLNKKIKALYPYGIRRRFLWTMQQQKRLRHNLRSAAAPFTECDYLFLM
jgi:hypothetical protein